MGGHVCGSVWALSRTCALMPGSHKGRMREYEILSECAAKATWWYGVVSLLSKRRLLTLLVLLLQV